MTICLCVCPYALQAADCKQAEWAGSCAGSTLSEQWCCSYRTRVHHNLSMQGVLLSFPLICWKGHLDRLRCLPRVRRHGVQGIRFVDELVSPYHLPGRALVITRSHVPVGLARHRIRLRASEQPGFVEQHARLCHVLIAPFFPLCCILHSAMLRLVPTLFSCNPSPPGFSLDFILGHRLLLLRLLLGRKPGFLLHRSHE